MIIVRSLSESESFYVNFKISVQVVCELSGKMTPIILQKALNHAAKRHPFLACIVIKKNEIFHFVKDQQPIVPLQVVPSGTDFDLIIRKELNTHLDESKNLIRAVMLEGKDQHKLIFTIHHAIIDGLSAVQLIKFILETCSDIQRDGFPKESPTLSIQPSIEELSASLVSATELTDFIARFAKEAQSTNLQAIEPNIIIDNQILPSTEVHHVKFSCENTKTLFEIAKSKQCSIHCIIAALHLITIRQFIDNTDTELMLRCNTPVDLRQRLSTPLSNDNLLSAATGCGTNHAVSIKTSPWKLAQDIRIQSKDSLESRDVFKAHLTFMDTLMKHRVPNAVGISSVGLINSSKDYYGFECDSLYLTGVYQLPMFGVTVYTYNNQLVMTYMYAKPYYSTELINNIATSVLERCLALE